ncbi:hypothetical protein [Planktotalea sp.]|uniref:hypothetical protein n=1 Tax=Planktotalea sp. TaxID=2029877 RepID=UPI003D6ACA7D
MKRFVFLFSIALAVGAPLCADSDVWRLHIEQAKCIQDNVANYLASQQDPLVIVVKACPETDLAAAMAKSAQNSGIFNVSEGDDVLILQPSELSCFGRLPLDDAAGPVIEIDRVALCE